MRRAQSHNIDLYIDFIPHEENKIKHRLQEDEEDDEEEDDEDEEQSEDGFDWDDLDSEEDTDEQHVYGHGRHCFFCLSSTSSKLSWICFLIMTAISVAVCVAVFVTVKPQQDPTMVSYNLALWFTFVAFMFCITLVMQMIIEVIPWVIRKIATLLVPKRSEIVRYNLAVSIYMEVYYTQKKKVFIFILSVLSRFKALYQTCSDRCMGMGSMDFFTDRSRFTRRCRPTEICTSFRNSLGNYIFIHTLYLFGKAHFTIYRDIVS